MFSSFTLLGSLVACSGFNAQDAHTVFDGSHAAAFKGFRSAWVESEDASARDTGTFTFTSTDTGFDFAGDVTGDSDWTGTIHLDGALATTDDGADWTFGLDYLTVMVDEVTYEGGLDWDVSVVGTPTSASLSYGCIGEIIASGAVEGTGAVDYQVDVTVTENSFSFVAEGEIDGTPIDSSFTFTVL